MNKYEITYLEETKTIVEATNKTAAMQIAKLQGAELFRNVKQLILDDDKDKSISVSISGNILLERRVDLLKTVIKAQQEVSKGLAKELKELAYKINHLESKVNELEIEVRK